MLVEFHVDDVLGLSLYVSQREYSKADKSDSEFASLEAAINAYMALQGLDYLPLDEELYRSIYQRLQKSGSMVITTATTNTVPEYCIFQILVANNGKQRIVVDWVGDGYALID